MTNKEINKAIHELLHKDPLYNVIQEGTILESNLILEEALNYKPPECSIVTAKVPNYADDMGLLMETVEDLMVRDGTVLSFSYTPENDWVVAYGSTDKISALAEGKVLPSVIANSLINYYKG